MFWMFSSHRGIGSVYIWWAFDVAYFFFANTHFSFLLLLPHLICLLYRFISMRTEYLHIIVLLLLKWLLGLIVIDNPLGHYHVLALLVEFGLFGHHALNFFLWANACHGDRRIGLLSIGLGNHLLLLIDCFILLLVVVWVGSLFWVAGEHKPTLATANLRCSWRLLLLRIVIAW